MKQMGLFINQPKLPEKKRKKYALLQKHFNFYDRNEIDKNTLAFHSRIQTIATLERF